jgi:hypothetical protein
VELLDRQLERSDRTCAPRLELQQTERAEPDKECRTGRRRVPSLRVSWKRRVGLRTRLREDVEMVTSTRQRRSVRVGNRMSPFLPLTAGPEPTASDARLGAPAKPNATDCGRDCSTPPRRGKKHQRYK